MPSRPDEPIWYAAYGSNIEQSRFGFYLEGGTHPITGRVTPGCRDRRPPDRDQGIVLDHPVVFARHSRGWEGGIAFLDDARAGRTFGRAWRITLEQLLDVVAQENGNEPGTLPLGRLDGLGPDRRSVVVHPNGWYGRMVWCGELEGRPVLTCTADWVLSSEEPAPPSPTYLATIARGLRELGHRDADIVAYLLSLSGVAPAWTATSVSALLTPVG